MRRYLFILVLAMSFFLAGCGKVKITPMMCNQIRKNPNATIPKECVEYNKKQVNKDWYGNHTNSKPPKDIFKVDKAQ